MFPDMEKLDETINRAIAYINALKSENEKLKGRIKELEEKQNKAKETIDRIIEKFQQIMR